MGLVIPLNAHRFRDLDLAISNLCRDSQATSLVVVCTDAPEDAIGFVDLLRHITVVFKYERHAGSGPHRRDASPRADERIVYGVRRRH